MTARDLRVQILEKCDIVQAILSFNYCLGAADKQRLDRIRNKAAGATKRMLKGMYEDINDNLLIIAKRFGCKQKAREFAAGFIAATSTSPDELNISKASIDSDFFSNFCDGNPLWRVLPPHLRLAVCYNWVFPEGAPQFHYFLPEAMLYEDMALAYNEAVRTQNEAVRTQSELPEQRPKGVIRPSRNSTFTFERRYSRLFTLLKPT